MKLNLKKNKGNDLFVLTTNTRVRIHLCTTVPIVADYPIESIYPLMLTQAIVYKSFVFHGESPRI